MKFSLRFTKILSTTILAVLLGSIVLPAGIAFAQTTLPPEVQIIEDATPVDVVKDLYSFFKTLFDIPVESNGKTYISGIGQDAYSVVADGGVDVTGVKGLSIQLELAMDKKKAINSDQKFNDIYYDAVADESRNKNFFVEARYVDASGVDQHALYKSIVEGEVDPNPSGNQSQQRTTIYHYNQANSLYVGQQVRVQIPLVNDKPLPYGKPVEVSFWYCGGVLGGDNAKNQGTKATDGTKAPDDTSTNPRNKTFTNVFYDGNPGQDICSKGSGSTAYRIGKKVSVIFQNQESAVASTAGQSTTDQTSATSANALPSCGLVFTENGTFMGCIALVIYHIFFRLAAVFAYLMGNIFDFFLGYSISSLAYTHPFVTSAWETVRDIANIFFIILLIYVAIGSIFGISGVSKKLVGTIIVNAILINFSLLITRGVIDISNITARVFYAQIHVQNKDSEVGTVGGVAGIGTQEDKKDENSDSGYKGVSTIMLQSFDPQRVFDKALQGNPRTEGESNAANKNTGGTANFGAQRMDLQRIQNESPEEYAGYFALVTLICAFIAFMTGLLFWNIGFIFIGRVIGLYISMIFSPFAFMSRDIPFLSKLEGWYFSNWKKDLVSYAVVAPMTIVFFYIVIQIMQTPFYSTKVADTNYSFTYTLLWIVIPLLIIYGLLDKGKKMIIAAAGELGTRVQGAMTKAAGIAGGAAFGVAAGGAAFAGRSLIGKGAKALQSNGVGQFFERNQNNKIFGGINRAATRGLTSAQSASFDVRQSKTASAGLNALTGKLGIQKEFSAQTDSKTLAALRLGTEETKGGIKAQEKRAEEKAQKDVNEIQTNAKDAKTAQVQWQNITNSDYKKNQKKYITEAKANLSANGTNINDPTNTQLIQTEAKKLHEKAFKEATDNVTVHDNASLTEAMRQMRAKRIKENPGGWLGKVTSAIGYEGALGKASSLGLVGGGATALGVVVPAAALLADIDTEREARRKGATESEKNRKKLFDKQNEVAKIIDELRGEIKNTAGNSYDADLADKFEKNHDKNGTNYTASDELIEEAAERHANVLKEDLKTLQDELKKLKEANTRIPSPTFNTENQAKNKEIAAMQKNIKRFSNIKSERENVKKKFEENAKPKEEKKDK